MINVKLKESNREVDLSAIAQSPIEIDQQLDMSLDSGTLSYLVAEPDDKGLNEALAGYSITANNVTFDFVGVDSRAMVCRDDVLYYTDETITVNQSAMLTSSTEGCFYKHSAQGTILVSGGSVKEIVSVTGSMQNTFPNAHYDGKQIVWNVLWTNTSNYGNDFPYDVTITYVLERAHNQSIYSHQVALTEPSKLLQGVMIDGFGVSQPEDYASRKTLYDVVNRLLAVTPFDGQRFTLTKDVTVEKALKAVKSPEFKWNTQTTLWECLLQVGAVIDAMPRLVADSDDNYTVITFDFVNASVGEVNWIDDGLTNALGENVNESQYNTALSAIVENLRENE